jgi:hypothetical protein
LKPVTHVFAHIGPIIHQVPGELGVKQDSQAGTRVAQVMHSTIRRLLLTLEPIHHMTEECIHVDVGNNLLGSPVVRRIFSGSIHHGAGFMDESNCGDLGDGNLLESE